MRISYVNIAFTTFLFVYQSLLCALYDWLEYLDVNHEVQQFQQRQRHGRDWHFYNYRWVNTIPLRDTQPALLVNWLELTFFEFKIQN